MKERMDGVLLDAKRDEGDRFVQLVWPKVFAVRDLDGRVYRLDGLTPDRIKMVEETDRCVPLAAG